MNLGYWGLSHRQNVETAPSVVETPSRTIYYIHNKAGRARRKSGSVCITAVEPSTTA